MNDKTVRTYRFRKPTYILLNAKFLFIMISYRLKSQKVKKKNNQSSYSTTGVIIKSLEKEKYPIHPIRGMNVDIERKS